MQNYLFSFISHVHESEESPEIHQRLILCLCYLMISELWLQVIGICLVMSSSRADH